jgi:3D (Asp-Asp-Asp) domain-containing protein
MRTILKYGIYWLNKAVIALIILVLALNMQFKEADAAWSFEDVTALIENKIENMGNLPLVIGGSSIMSVNKPATPKMMSVILTAYSSTVDQTDDTPFTTASNTLTHDGVIAANFLAFGTKVKIPGIFGDKVFTVEDRMARKHDGKIDIWFPERYLAKNFGVQEADVLILE